MSVIEEISIKYNFEVIHPKHGSYRDTLYLDYDRFKNRDRKSITDDPEVIALKQQRLSNWVRVLENPPTPSPVEEVELTKREMQQKLVEIAHMMGELEQEKVEIEDKIYKEDKKQK